jgi:hypothetical protein
VRGLFLRFRSVWAQICWWESWILASFIFVLDLDPPNSEVGLRLKDFGWNLDLFRLRTQVLGHSIPWGCFTSSPNLSSRAQAVWEIHGGIEEVDFLVFTSGCFVRGLADCTPLAHGPSARCKFVACSSSSCELALRSFEVSKVCCRLFCRTVCVRVPDRLRGGWTILLGITDCPRSTSCSRIVRGPGMDHPRVGVLVWSSCYH